MLVLLGILAFSGRAVAVQRKPMDAEAAKKIAELESVLHSVRQHLHPSAARKEVHHAPEASFIQKGWY